LHVHALSVQQSFPTGMAATKRRGADARWFLHDDEVRFLEVFHKTFGDNIRHDFSGGRDGPATADAQRGCERQRYIFRVGEREAIGVGHWPEPPAFENKARTRIGSLRSMVDRP
jgi:hypothetical protein